MSGEGVTSDRWHVTIYDFVRSSHWVFGFIWIVVRVPLSLFYPCVCDGRLSRVTPMTYYFTSILYFAVPRLIIIIIITIIIIIVNITITVNIFNITLYMKIWPPQLLPIRSGSTIDAARRQRTVVIISMCTHKTMFVIVFPLWECVANWEYKSY